MAQLESLADISSMRTHHYDALDHLLDTAAFYQKQKTRGISRDERHETLQHLAAVAKTTLQIEEGKTSQTVGGRVREAVRLVRQG